jgi:CRISPR/Cas system-associated exonuclease Cas4 (RecB family)
MSSPVETFTPVSAAAAVAVAAPAPAPTYLAEKNAHERDQYITFDEGPHIYTVHGEQGYTSVTTWNHLIFGSSFDEEGAVSKILKKREWKTKPEYMYYQKSAEEIKQMWEDNRVSASSAGTKLHYNVECYYNNIPVVNDSIEYQYFLNFVADYPNLEAYRTEWCVYHEELKISGSIDMVFRDKVTGEFYIYDWKRSKEINYECKYGDKKGNAPCVSHLPDSNFWHYSAQLNTYRMILEEKYGVKIAGMFLICIHPNNILENYERIEVQDLRKDMEKIKEYRLQMLADAAAGIGEATEHH